MTFKKLEVPTSSITEVKKSPMDVFQQARKEKTGVYIFNREKIAGVMLTQELYESLVKELDDLRAKKEEIVVTNPPEATSQARSDELLELVKTKIVPNTTIAVKKLDEQLTDFGFSSKRDAFQGIDTLLEELQTTGKLTYVLAQANGTPFAIELIGEEDYQSTFVKKIIIKKILVKD
ncbi:MULTISPECIES: hypothetical protein [Enterococcus]|uniref:Prevent-host-death protein n=1 Tax=Enterococcus sulfureus ATCC 49903 TaxID=1140003 RepID=S0NZL0_9ENTE|nr:hypothetical protein [Enterococcus sulfureus]EOT51345.1 hypothetical protein OMY_00058 [Enterococcus sulfureus ATCC 49903]EOT87002.1 hypothetical protein I573_00057 [Enterococcus sulfureus ATCC 49903]